MDLDKKTLDYPSLDNIVDYQFYSQRQGVLLNENNLLYKSNENDIKEINIPENINITHAYFINSTEGAVSGYMTNLNHEKANLVDAGLLIKLPI